MSPEELEHLPPALLEVDGVRARVDASLALWKDAYGQCTGDQAQLEPRGAGDLVVALSSHADDTIVYVRPADGRAFHEQFGCSVSGALLDHAGTARLGNFLFVVGGYDMGYDVTDRVHRYDPRFRNWMPVASLLQKRVNFAISSSSSNIYVVGGSTRERPAADPSAADSGAPDEDEYGAEPGEGETPLKTCEKYECSCTALTCSRVCGASSLLRFGMGGGELGSALPKAMREIAISDSAFVLSVGAKILFFICSCRYMPVSS